MSAPVRTPPGAAPRALRRPPHARHSRRPPRIGIRFGGDGGDPGCGAYGGGAFIGDAVGDARAAEAAPGDEQSGMLTERAVDGGDAIQMADFVLGVAALEPVHAREER